MSSQDPLNILTNPPSTVVKVQGTSRDDVNGQLGIAVQWTAERGRYMIHMIESQTTMALKPDNVVKAGFLEGYKAQIQQLMKDPRIRREITRYYNMANTRLGVKPEYVGGFALVLLVVMIYLVGLTKTLTLLSMLMLCALIIGPDIMSGAPIQTVLRNFPGRCRESIEQSVPFVRGRLNDRVAAGIIIFMLVLSGRALLQSQNQSIQTKPAQSGLPPKVSQVSIEDAYKLGFEDASQGKEFGTSMSESSPTLPSSRDMADDQLLEHDPIGYVPTQPPKKSAFGFSQAMSGFYIYRTVMEMGNGPEGFSPQRMIAGLKVLEVWKLGLLGFSLYNLVSAFI